MSINCYTGLMGSGKSYEVVANVIVPAINSGRDVRTNIDGLNAQLIYDYCVETFVTDPEKLGKIYLFDIEQIKSKTFFPIDYKSDNINSFIQPGDLVVLDEAWRVWGTDCKIPEEHKIFFREHRHFCDSKTGVCCDLVAIVQDISDLNRTLKVVVEFSFRTSKLKSIGRPDAFTLNMWNGHKQYDKTVLDRWTKKYNPKIFPLYKSYANTTSAVEANSDARVNIFSGKSVKIKIILYILFFVSAIIYVANYFYSKIHPDSKSNSQITYSPETQKIHNNNPTQKIISENDFRIVGTINIDGFEYVVLNSKNGLKFESPLKFTGFGSGLTGVIDGKTVTRYSGSLPSTQKQDK